MVNRKVGNTFESEVCNILFEHGFWAHNLAQNQAGQPADILAVRNKVAYLIDCKVCSGKVFSLSRVEENQDLSMDLWKMCGNGEGWFAIKLAGIIYMVPHFTVKAYMEHKSVMTPTEIFKAGKTLEEWMARCK